MTLLGVPLLVTLAVVALLLPIATWLLWSRVRGPRPVRAGSRLGMLFAGQLATVLLVAALANDYGDFYTSWSDLFGDSGSTAGATILSAGGPAPVRASRGAGVTRMPPGTRPRDTRAGELRVLGDTSFSTSAQWATRGRVESVMLTGRASGLSSQGFVYLPPQYFQPAFAHRRFPAVEVLTGYPGSAQGEVDHQNFPGHTLQQLQEHHIGPMVSIYLRSAVVATRDTECTDVPGGPQAQTYLSQDVPNVVQATLRVRPHDWGIMGYSTGGYCATKILMAHPDVFRTGVSQSGYYHTLEDPTTGNLWGGSTVLRQLNDPEWVVKHETPPPVSLMVTIGRQEEGYADTMRFLHLIRPPMQVTAVVLPHGGHNFVTWGAELPRAFGWLWQHLAKG